MTFTCHISGSLNGYYPGAIVPNLTYLTGGQLQLGGQDLVQQHVGAVAQQCCYQFKTYVWKN